LTILVAEICSDNWIYRNASNASCTQT